MGIEGGYMPDMNNESPSEKIQSSESLDAKAALPEGEEREKAIERRQEIIGEAKEGRSKLLGGIFDNRLKDIATSPLAQKAVHFIPLLGDSIFIKQAIKGKEGERELSVKERAWYAAIGMSSFAAFACYVFDEKEASGQFEMLAKALQHGPSLLSYIRTGAEIAGKIGKPELASVLVAASVYGTAAAEGLKDMKYLFDDALISLNLDEASAA